MYSVVRYAVMIEFAADTPALRLH